jgi:membrane protease YdiL (CAAX protease family)
MGATGNAVSRGRTGSKRTLLLAAAAYVLLLAAFWWAASHFSLGARIQGHLGSTFIALALLLLPYWFFGFGGTEILRGILTRRAARILAPGSLVAPYLIFSLPRGEFRWWFAIVLFAIPVAIASLFEYLPPADQGLSWQDVVVLAIVGLPVEFRWLAGSFPHPGLSALPKLLLVDAALYGFLVIRGLEGVGYDFRVRARDLVVGLRECFFFAPIGIGLGIAIGFIRPHGGVPSASLAAAAVLITLFFVAIPEELFFRGLLQNLLERRIGYRSSLLVTAAIFGLSHFNKPLPFNWRYVILGTIAGVFYGRAWHDRGRLPSSATTHTLVDVIWSLWFR